MAESWEEYKKKKQKEFGTLEFKVEKSQPRIKSNPRAENIDGKLYNVHKRSLPAGVPPMDKIVVFALTKTEAEWWVERRLKTKCYDNSVDDSKTIIYYDIIPVNATPRERSIYYNTHPVITEEVPGYNSPKRIN